LQSPESQVVDHARHVLDAFLGLARWWNLGVNSCLQGLISQMDSNSLGKEVMNILRLLTGTQCNWVTVLLSDDETQSEISGGARLERAPGRGKRLLVRCAPDPCIGMRIQCLGI
jgi:hypothetical protein